MKNTHTDTTASWTDIRFTSERHLFFFSFFSHTSTFQLLDKPWSQVSSLCPPGSCLQFSSRIGFSNPTARHFFIDRVVLLTHALALSARSIWTQEKVPTTNVYEYALGEIQTNGTDLYTSLEDNLILHRGDRLHLRYYIVEGQK